MEADLDGKAYNRLIWANAAGEVATYDKQHLVPGWEGRLTPGRNAALMRQSRVGAVGAAICKDMDFSALGRRYAGARMMLVPGWDFRGDWGEDGYAHGRLAVLRGVETGYSVVRSARIGRLVVTDLYGHVAAETPSRPEGAVLVVDAPLSSGGSTPYGRLGDLFGWACLAAAVVGGLALRRRPDDAD